MFEKDPKQLSLDFGGRPADFSFKDALNDPSWKATEDDYLAPVLIPKRTGGFREILEPRAYLKDAQKRVVHYLYSMGFGASPFAHGFVTNRSRKTNAAPHVGHRFLLKMDIEDFFGNCTPEKVLKALKELKPPDFVVDAVVRMCFLKGGLPQGAPSSPVLSNIVAREMDFRIDGLRKAWRRGSVRRGGRLDPISFTRYADDVTFSSNYPNLRDLVYPVKAIVEACGFKVKDKKTKFFATPQRLETCGVVVSKDKMNSRRSQRRFWRGRLYKMVKDIEMGALPPGHYKDKDGNVKKLGKKALLRIQGHIAAICDLSPQDKEKLFGLFRKLEESCPNRS